MTRDRVAATSGPPPAPRQARAFLRLLAMLILTLGLLLTGAVPASAHPALVSSQPGAGYALTEAPADITLNFNERVSLPDRPLILRDTRGRTQPLRVSLDPSATTMRGVPNSELPVGAYEVSYHVIGRDGDLILGTFRFGVATPVGDSISHGTAQGDPDRVQPGTTALRGLLFLGLALALGGLYLAWRVDVATGSLPGVQPFVRAGSLMGLASAAGLLAALGPLSQVNDRAATGGVTRLLLAEAVLFLIAAATARLRPGGGLLAGTCLLGVVVLEGIRAHPSEVRGAIGATLTGVHLLAGALWLGGLVHTLRLGVAWRAKRLAGRIAVTTYARSAAVLVGVVVTTGTVSALLLLPSRADWTATTYGRVLLLKVALVVLVLAAAMLARHRLSRGAPASPSADAGPVGGSSPSPGPGPRQGRAPLGRAAAVEAGILATVVLVAAAVTTVTPARLVPISTLLAAPIGPTLRTAERVGQVTVSAVVSQGRLELHADAPDDGKPLRIELGGRILTATGIDGRLELTSCGPSCWTGPVDWAAGSNSLTLDVDAHRWQAGRVTLPVQWPVVPAPGLLARVQKAMGARTRIDTFETVTSGFNVDVPTRSRRTGLEYLETQPWADGGAVDATLILSGRKRTLLFALPALGYHFAMQLDALDRVVSERIVTPNHLLTRQYSFPAAG